MPGNLDERSFRVSYKQLRSLYPRRLSLHRDPRMSREIRLFCVCTVQTIQTHVPQNKTFGKSEPRYQLKSTTKFAFALFVIPERSHCVFVSYFLHELSRTFTYSLFIAYNSDDKLLLSCIHKTFILLNLLIPIDISHGNVY